jgi:hypothetical protein
MREAGLQEIAGIGPTRKRALLHHFGTLKAIERASVADLMQGRWYQRRKRAQDFRVFPRPAGLIRRRRYVIRKSHLPRACRLTFMRGGMVRAE